MQAVELLKIEWLEIDCSPEPCTWWPAHPGCGVAQCSSYPGSGSTPQSRKSVERKKQLDIYIYKKNYFTYCKFIFIMHPAL